MRTLLAALAGLTLATLSLAAHAADEKKVVIAYQTGAVPYFVGIANGDIAKKTGWDIEFRRFNSGADIFAAIASGDVQIGDVGSSPFAAAVSRGIDVKGVLHLLRRRRRRGLGGPPRHQVAGRPQGQEACRRARLDRPLPVARRPEAGGHRRERSPGHRHSAARNRGRLEARRHRRRLRLGSRARGTEEGRQGAADLRPGGRARSADLQRARSRPANSPRRIPNSSASTRGWWTATSSPTARTSPPGGLTPRTPS